MKFITLILMVIFLSCSTRNQEIKHEEVVKDIMTKHLDEYVLEEKIFSGFNPFLETYEPLIRIYFTDNDIKYLKEQFADSSMILWDSSQFSRFEVVSSDELHDKIESNANLKYCKFSLPIYSIDYKTAVISYSSYCGPMCSRMTLIIVKKKDDVWEIVKELKTMIS